VSFATVQSCTLSGVTALPVTVEVHIGGGLPGMSLVGLPQSSVRESKDRVKAAITNSGFKYPLVKIVVNLAPADLPKQGGRFDLPIALGILLATGQLPIDACDKFVVVGELGLTGQIRSVSGALPTALSLAGSKKTLLVPSGNANEAALSEDTSICVANTLRTLVAELSVYRPSLYKLTGNLSSDEESELVNEQDSSRQLKSTHLDMADIRGQQHARRALEIAAAGSHNLLMVGPPGTGKSMLASRLPAIQPDMTQTEAIETASVQSISHAGFQTSDWGRRPFRSPHHTASGVALVGGGLKPMPGEISLAHNGVLFLDELAEFPRAVLDVLREPMETGLIHIARAAKHCEFPARFQLVAAMNPCPCGYHGDAEVQCRCTPDQIARYAMRVSGPFLDRMDLHVRVNRVATELLQSDVAGESSQTVRARVSSAHLQQINRQGVVNRTLVGKELSNHVRLSKNSTDVLNTAAKKFAMSLRSIHRVMRVARTIADLEQASLVSDAHLLEALSFRREQ